MQDDDEAATDGAAPAIYARRMSGVLSRAVAASRRPRAATEAPGQALPRFLFPTLDWLIVVGLLALLALQTPAISDANLEYGVPSIEPAWGWRATGWAWALQLALVLPLLWRRRAPLAVFLVCSAVAFVQWLAGPELYGDVAVLIALYTVVAHEPRGRLAAIAGGITLIGLSLAVQRWALSTTAGPAATISLTAMVAIPVALGLVTRNRQRLLALTRHEAARAERERIAREMHDVVTHNLTVMVALSDGARLTFDRDPAGAADAVAQIGRTGREGLAEMRRLLGVLADPDAAGDEAPLRPQPGLDSLATVVETVRAAGLQVDLDIDPEVAMVPAGLGLAVHRIAQEALTNVLRHAPRAAHVRVAVRRSGDAIVAVVQDDGGPTVPARRSSGGGAGLAGMSARAQLHGGTLDAGPNAEGWRVETTLPLGRGETPA